LIRAGADVYSALLGFFFVVGAKRWEIGFLSLLRSGVGPISASSFHVE
jgi:hypothetical protein